MATNNAINTAFPFGVGAGGTGKSSFAFGSLLVGDGGSAIKEVPIGSDGQLLAYSSSSGPYWTSTIEEDFGLAGYNSVGRYFSIYNGDGAGEAQLLLEVGGPGSGDPFIQYYIRTGTYVWYQGIDNSDNGKFKLSANGGLGDTDVFVMTTTGSNTLPKQPAFLAYLTSTASDVTGDGTNYTIICGTEIFDQASNYNAGTGVFTAPVTGKYMFIGTIALVSDASGGLVANASIVTSNRYYIGDCYPTNNQVAGFNGTNSLIVYRTVIVADMDASDTAYMTILSGTGAQSKTDDVYGHATDLYTYFCGYLAC